MVLVSASTVGVMLSGGVVCLFTFLLFMSGYVLQQQTVRSLQEALQAPIEERYYKQKSQFDVETSSEQDTVVNVSISEEILSDLSAQVQIVLGADDTSEILVSKEESPRELWREYVDSLNIDKDVRRNDDLTFVIDQSYTFIDRRLAYVLPLPETRSLCSAILFTKWHRQFSTLDKAPTIIFLYPSDWETSPTTDHMEAMRLLRESELVHRILYHPVPISKVWTGVDIESQLLSELARVPWSYDRILYLKTPGIALDIQTLDAVLEQSDPKKSWTRLKHNGRSRSSTAALHPDVMLWAPGKGLMTPINSMQGVTATAHHDLADTYAADGRYEVFGREAAYVIFDEDNLSESRQEKKSHVGIFARFERDRHEVCEGTSLLL